MKNKFKIFICSTEQSGDNIGYNIMSQLIKHNSDIIFDGVGGNKMSSILNKQFFSLRDFNTIGIFEIIFSIKKYYKMINFLTKEILSNKYDLIITIDSPDFNYPLIKTIRNKNYKNKIIQIVAPTVWAWREYRAKKFAKIFDEILVLFNFEIEYFVKYNIKTTLIGHPVYYINKFSNFKTIDKKIIAFLPGSRMNEIKKLFPYFNLAYQYLFKNSSNVSIFIPTLPHLEEIIQNYVKNWKIKTIILTNQFQIENYYSMTSKAIVCSGTASLEIAKRNIPQIVIYKLNIFTELFVKNFIKVKYANIINILENKMIIPEIINSNLSQTTFLNQFYKLMNDEEKNKLQIENVNLTLKKIQGYKPPYEIASDRIISYL